VLLPYLVVTWSDKHTTELKFKKKCVVVSLVAQCPYEWTSSSGLEEWKPNHESAS